MKLSQIARLAVVGVAVLTTVALASAQIVIRPRKQYALVTDMGKYSGFIQDFKPNTGYVRRIDCATGADLGSFGDGLLTKPVSIAVQPSTGVAYVAETATIKRFDVLTGQYLGSIVSNVGYGFQFEAIRFNSAGELYGIARATDASKYRVLRFDPTTGACTGLSPVIQFPSHYVLSLDFRPDGTIEATRFDDNYTTFVDKIGTNFAYQGSTAFSSANSHAFQVYRTSNDVYCRWSWSSIGGYDVAGGVGNVGAGQYAGWVSAYGDGQMLFAEGIAHRTYALVHGANGQYRLLTYDTSGAPQFISDMPVAYSSYIWQSSMAIFVK